MRARTRGRAAIAGTMEEGCPVYPVVSKGASVGKTWAVLTMEGRREGSCTQACLLIYSPTTSNSRAAITKLENSEDKMLHKALE